MNRYLFPCFALTLGCSSAVNEHASAPEQRPVGGPCDGCELLFEGMPAPEAIGPVVMLASATEPGERMIVEGRATGADGLTPAANVVLYAYHTDAQGIYSPADGQTHARRHGHLRGWVRTGADGRFTLNSIRPASYPGERIPAHIHIFVKEPDKGAYYIDEVRFLDDPLLTPEERERAPGRGGDLDIALMKDSVGSWRGELTIALGRNVPGY